MTVLVQTIRSLAIPDIDFADLAYKAGIKTLDIVLSLIGQMAMTLVIGALLTLWLAGNTLAGIGEIISQLH